MPWKITTAKDNIKNTFGSHTGTLWDGLVDIAANPKVINANQLAMPVPSTHHWVISIRPYYTTTPYICFKYTIAKYLMAVHLYQHTKEFHEVTENSLELSEPEDELLE